MGDDIPLSLLKELKNIQEKRKIFVIFFCKFLFKKTFIYIRLVIIFNLFIKQTSALLFYNILVMHPIFSIFIKVFFIVQNGGR